MGEKSKLSFVIDCLVESGAIDEADRAVYYFGLKEGLIFIGNLIITLVISGIARDVKSGTVFFLCFFPVRRYAGGFHARTRTRCFWYSMLVVLLAMESIGGVMKLGMNYQLAMIYMLSVLIFAMSPVENCNKPLDPQEKKVYKRYLLLVLLAECALAFIAGVIGANYIISCIVVSLSVCLILNILGRMSGKNLKKHNTHSIIQLPEQ